MNEEPLWILCALDWGQNRKDYYPLGPEGILQNCIFSSDLWWFYTKKSSRIICTYVVGYWEITRSTNFYTYKRWDCWEPIWCALGKKIGTVLLQKFKQKFGFE